MRRVAAAALCVLPLAVASPAAATPAQPLSAKAAISIDAVTGRVLYQLHAGDHLPPASLAKMVVALVTAKALSPTDRVVISHRAATVRPDNIHWVEGMSETVDDMLHAMILESSNGAAIALAERVAGTVEAFMPIAAAELQHLGATQTQIVDPSGLDAPGQYATAHDLALMAAAVVRDPWLARVVRTWKRTIPWAGGSTYTLHTMDGFLVRYKDAIGVKNGYTSKAGNCLAAAATRNGRTVVTVVMNDRRWYADTVALMEAGFPGAKPGALIASSGAMRPLPPVISANARPRGAHGVSTQVAALSFAGVLGAMVVRRRHVLRRRA